MKKLQVWAISLLIALFSFNAVANTKSNTKQQTRAEKNLQMFNETLALNLQDYGFSKASDGSDVIEFNYTVGNRSKYAIRSIHWVARFVLDNEVILIQDTPVKFEDKAGLKGRSGTEVKFAIPFAQLSPEAQQAFVNRTTDIRVFFQAKNIMFVNGGRLVISK